MPRSPKTYLTVLSIGLAFVVYSDISARAQVYPQGIVTSPGRRLGDTLTQQSAGGTGFDSTLDFLKRKDEEERERREIQNRQRRILDNYTSVPDVLRDSYFKRADTPFSGTSR
jgi:hypothetical protein